MFRLKLNSDMDEDISWLKTIAVGMLNDLGCHGSAIIPEDLINEMCRFGGAELHAVAALIGGIASEEVIKVRKISSISLSVMTQKNHSFVSFWTISARHQTICAIDWDLHIQWD